MILMDYIQLRINNLLGMNLDDSVKIILCAAPITWVSKYQKSLNIF